MSDNTQEKRKPVFTHHAVVVGIVAVIGLLVANATLDFNCSLAMVSNGGFSCSLFDFLREMASSVVVNLFTFMMLHPVVLCMTMIVIVVGFVMKGIVETNRRLYQ